MATATITPAVGNALLTGVCLRHPPFIEERLKKRSAEIRRQTCWATCRTWMRAQERHLRAFEKKFGSRSTDWRRVAVQRSRGPVRLSAVVAPRWRARGWSPHDSTNAAEANFDLQTGSAIPQGRCQIDASCFHARARRHRNCNRVPHPTGSCVQAPQELQHIGQPVPTRRSNTESRAHH